MKSQRGVTLSGLIMACIVLGVAALLVMRLWPIYNEKMKVDQAMDKLATNPDAARMTKPEIVQAIMRQFDVSDVDRFDTAALTKVVTVGKKKGSNNKVVIMAYEIRAPLFSNLDVVMNYRNVKEFGPAKTD
ncbi:MAG: DUF4845 domain-containing protein [Gammaproteobacteria bacterium]|nr:DUF4845 domain-containing protein [Gammaproteobacteria bacterium]